MNQYTNAFMEALCGNYNYNINVDFSRYLERMEREWKISHPTALKIVGKEGIIKKHIKIDGAKEKLFLDNSVKELMYDLNNHLSDYFSVTSFFFKGEGPPLLVWYADMAARLTYEISNKVTLPRRTFYIDGDEVEVGGYKNARKSIDHFLYNLPQDIKDAIKQVDTIYKNKQDTSWRFYPYSPSDSLERYWMTLTQLEQMVSKNICLTSGDLVISALPEDLLSMSWNGFNWASCVEPEGGDYPASIFAHIRGERTLIAYFQPDDAPDFDVNGAVFSNKRWRMLLYLDDFGNVGFATEYPTDSSTLFKAVIEWVQKKIGGQGEEIDREETDICFDGVYIDPIEYVVFSEEYNSDTGFTLFQETPCYETDQSLTYADFGVVGIDLITLREEECVICGEMINLDYDPWEQIPEYYGKDAYICELCTKEAYARAERI